jgi:hypothetical protein
MLDILLGLANAKGIDDNQKILENIQRELNSQKLDRDLIDKASKIIMDGVTIYSLKQQIVRMHEKYNKLMMDNLNMRYKLGLPPKDENNTFDGDF